MYQNTPQKRLAKASLVRAVKCVFRGIVDTYSNRSWTLVPNDHGQRFRRDRGHFPALIGMGVHDRGISVHDVGIMP